MTTIGGPASRSVYEPTNTISVHLTQRQVFWVVEKPRMSTTVSELMLFTKWTLGFNQFRLHHANRASTGVQLGGFVVPCLSEHAAFPLGFRLERVVTPAEVGSVAQEYHAQLLPCYTGIIYAVIRRTLLRIFGVDDVQVGLGVPFVSL